MAEIVGSIVLQNYGITNADISVVATGPNLEAYFNPSANEQIVWNKLQSVKKWKLYRRQDIPDRLHYRDNSRIPPILAIADEGLEIVCECHLITNLCDNLKINCISKLIMYFR